LAKDPEDHSSAQAEMDALDALQVGPTVGNLPIQLTSFVCPGRLAFYQSAPLPARRVEYLHADETLLFRLTYVCNFKRTRHEVWDYFETKVGFTMALFNILVQRRGFQPVDVIMPIKDPSIRSAE
jgi:hypothetical protein